MVLKAFVLSRLHYDLETRALTWKELDQIDQVQESMARKCLGIVGSYAKTTEPLDRGQVFGMLDIYPTRVTLAKRRLNWFKNMIRMEAAKGVGSVPLLAALFGDLPANVSVPLAPLRSPFSPQGGLAPHAPPLAHALQEGLEFAGLPGIGQSHDWMKALGAYDVHRLIPSLLEARRSVCIRPEFRFPGVPVAVVPPDGPLVVDPPPILGGNQSPIDGPSHVNLISLFHDNDTSLYAVTQLLGKKVHTYINVVSSFNSFRAQSTQHSHQMLHQHYKAVTQATVEHWKHMADPSIPTVILGRLPSTINKDALQEGRPGQKNKAKPMVRARVTAPSVLTTLHVGLK